MGLIIWLYDLTLMSLTLIIVYSCYFYYKYFTRENPLPGPIPLPLFGNLVDRGFDDFVGYVDRMKKKHGKMFEIYFGPSRFILFSKYDEDTLKMFDNSIHSKYQNRIPHIPGLDELYMTGKGIALNHNVNVWKFNRHFVTRALLTPSFSRQLAGWTQQLVEEMMDFWKGAADDDGSFETDVVEWIHRFSTDSITQITTGTRVHAIEAYNNELLLAQNKNPKRSGNDTTDATRFFKSIKTFVIGLYFFILFPPFARKHLPVLRNERNKYVENRDWLYRKLDKMIKQRRKEIDYIPTDQPLRSDMLTSMITAYTDRDICEVKFNDKELTRPLTDEEIRGNLCEIFIAGMDTTANSLTILVYFLAKHPNVLRKLHEELDVFFEGLGDGRLSSENITKLVYTEAVIKEVLRIYTPAPYTARNSTDVDVIAGRTWAKGTQYIVDINGISNSDEYWDEPEKFNPDRWLNNTNNEKPTLNISFGGGRRICPARRSAYVQLKCLVALIYHQLDIELVDKNTPLKTEFCLLRSFPNLNVRIKPRSFKSGN